MTYAAIATVCFSFAVYLLFAGTISANELVVAAVLASLTALWAHLIRTLARRRFAITAELLVHTFRGVADLLVGTCRAVPPVLMAVTSGASASRFQFSQFQYGRPDDPGDAARRAGSVLLASLAPDRFVIDLGTSRVLLHQFGRRDQEGDPRWLQ